jgi:MFS family permease
VTDPDASAATADRRVPRRIIAVRALRDFGDGFVAVLLPVHILGLGLGVDTVGLVSTVALLGSAALTIAIGMAGGRIDPRLALVLAALLMAATGFSLLVAESLVAIVVVALLGTLNPSAGSVSVFVPLEHAALTAAAPESARTGLFARYGLAGALAAAAGSLAAGLPELLARVAVTQADALRGMFALYALLGVAAAFLYRGLPRRPPERAPAGHGALGPSRGIVVRLALLFSVDSFAGGFVVQALLALWLFERFGLSLAAAGLFFFWSGLLAAVSYPVAAWLSRRIGLVNTMVFTHIPANLCLVAAALAPGLESALTLLLLRAFLSQMDVPARASYVMAVVTPAERTAAASFTSVPRSLAAAAGPALAGALFAAGHHAAPLIICGVLKTLYDVALLHFFRHVRPPEERGRGVP